jgi:hypothetical protein
MSHDRIGNAADPVASVYQTPGEVDVGAVCEPFVEAADGVEHLAAER